jgi:hypothetical protein
MKIHTPFILAIGIVLASCTSSEDAPLMKRESFIRFFSSASNISGTLVERDTDAGYIVAGEVKRNATETDALIIKTDATGNKIWEKLIPNSKIIDILPEQEAYWILEDRLDTRNGSDYLYYYLSLRLLEKNGDTRMEYIRRDTTTSLKSGTSKKSYQGHAIAKQGTDKLLILGSITEPDKKKCTYIEQINTSTLVPEWMQIYSLLGRDYLNCNSLYTTVSGKLLWASKVSTSVQASISQYSTVSIVEPNSIFENNSLYGENDIRNHAIESIKPSNIGYGAVGTYSDANEMNANIFFVRVDPRGNFITNSVRYFDGIDLTLSDRDLSKSQDLGGAICAVEDGFVIAGKTLSTPAKGNGGWDILLIKVDFFGNFLWSRLIGGSGDETVRSIHETSDGGLIMCGTNTVNNLSSMMLVKTDSNGNLLQ